MRDTSVTHGDQGLERKSVGKRRGAQKILQRLLKGGAQIGSEGSGTGVLLRQGKGEGLHD